MENKKYSLFVGRFQPLHNGHEKLFRTVLNEGKRVCIALRDTGVNESNPYTIDERREMFLNRFEKEIKEDNLFVITIPDIEEICFGRGVGYGIREISLDKETESISATKIREQNV